MFIVLSCKERSNEGDKYIGKWKSENSSTVIEIIKAGEDKYISRIFGKKENAAVVVYFDKGAFVIEDSSDVLLYVNGDKLETLNITYVRYK